MDWEFNNFLSVWFLRKFGQGSALFLIFQSLLVEFWKFWKFLWKKNVSLLWILFLFLCRVCAEGILIFFQNSAFPCAELCRVLGNSWCCWIFENFSKSFKLMKIWPGVCPILEILSFCLRLLKISEIRKYSKCRFLGKIGQGSALHWCFWFLKFSKCGFLRKFDQGSALFPKFWGFVRDFWKFLKFLKFLSVKF